MLRRRFIRLADEETASHAEVNEPLASPLLCFSRRSRRATTAGRGISGQVDDDMLADTADAFDNAAGQGFNGRQRAAEFKGPASS